MVGGAGFIGSHLVERLVERGRVTVFDNLSVGRRDFLQGPLAVGALRSGRGRRARSRRARRRSIAGHDVVFHLAANPEARWGLENPRLDLEQGTIATWNVLEAMRRTGAKTFVFSSSGTVYGDTAASCAEGDLGALPISLYGASKFAGEAMISAFVECFGLNGEHLSLRQRGRPARHPRGRPRFPEEAPRPPRTSSRCSATVARRSPTCRVEDCVDGILFGLDHARGRLDVFNIAPPDFTSVRRIAELCVAASPYPRGRHPLHGWRARLARGRASVAARPVAARGARVAGAAHERSGGRARGERARSRGVRRDMTLQAVILAGGLATRMQSVATSVPEVAAPGGRAAFPRVAARAARGVRLRRGAAPGRAPRRADPRLRGRRRGLRAQARYAEDGPRLLGTGGALRRALAELAPEFLVTYGDSFLPFDYSAPLRDLIDHPEASGTMAVFENHGQWDKSNTEVRGDVVARYEKNAAPGDRTLPFIDYGATALRKSVVAAYAEEAAFGLDVIQTSLTEQGKLRAYRAPERFYEIGSPEGLRELDAYFMAKTARK